MGCAAWGLAEAGHGGSLSPPQPPYHAVRLRDLLTQTQCRRVHEFEDKCKFIRENCRDEEVGFFDYLELYYCRFPDVPAIPFSIMAAWLVMLFTVGPPPPLVAAGGKLCADGNQTIGIAASDFFCINLSTIANILGMSESMVSLPRILTA